MGILVGAGPFLPLDFPWHPRKFVSLVCSSLGHMGNEKAVSEYDLNAVFFMKKRTPSQLFV
jgi:hypothetical protein